MRVRYVFKLKEPIRFEDHWPIPIMGGDLRIRCENRLATAIDITFTGQMLSLAPSLEQHVKGEVRASITVRDPLLTSVRIQLERAFAFLQCYFDVDISAKEAEAFYEGETPDEVEQIPVTRITIGRAPRPISMPYDLFTRAVMAAEVGQAPDLEATLLKTSRTAMFQERYIDSFRYSFLLIEFVYGQGRFKATQLKKALKSNADLKRIVTDALTLNMQPKQIRNSETEQLLARSPTAEEVIDHLVDKRGFYFHGNIGRKGGWRPAEQDAAEALCLLTLEVAMLMSHEAASAMFDSALGERHVENAKRVGAIMSMNVAYRFHRPGEGVDRKRTSTIPVPGTRVTAKMAASLAKDFLERFENHVPDGDLKTASCTVKDTGEKVFEIKIRGHAEEEDEGGEESAR